jgi:hypothetical protein
MKGEAAIEEMESGGWRVSCRKGKYSVGEREA